MRERRRIESKEILMQRLLIVLGILLWLAGVAWPWLSKLPFGRLPGDIIIERENFRALLSADDRLAGVLVSVVTAMVVVPEITWFLFERG